MSDLPNINMLCMYQRKRREQQLDLFDDHDDWYGQGQGSADSGALPIPSEDEVRGLFSLWNDALATLDADTVAMRYSGHPILLPTVSDIPRTNYSLIKDYFDHFLHNEPQGEIVDGKIDMGPGWAIDSGIYNFFFHASGKSVEARYTFAYTYEDDEWKISHHHSSKMPEQLPSITEEETRALFTRWNDALGTCKCCSLDTKTVDFLSE